MKKQILTIILVSAILMSTLNLFKINPIEIPNVKAEPGPPYLLVKNPYLNDSAYWSSEVAWGLEPGSYSIINSTGWWSYAKKQNPLHQWEFAKWYNPYGCTYALQGLYPPNHTMAEALDTPAIKGQGMNYYVYIPANITDGQIVSNVTSTRLKNPQAYGSDVLLGGGLIGALLWNAESQTFAAIFHRTNIGIYFFLALKVRFWNDSIVPEHLRGKETYLGWMTPREANEFYGNGPHAGHIEFWTDTRVALPTNPNNWVAESNEVGYPLISQGSVDYPAFVGSTQDWDFHNSRTMNTTDLSVYETVTVDVGKQFRELCEWWDSAKYHAWDPWVGRFLGFFFLAGYSFPSLEKLAFDIVGATLIGVGPTMELIQSDMACHFNWTQIYDYRDNGGQPVTDPLFWECIDNWKWLKTIGHFDPWQEFWRNTILPTETLTYRIGQVGVEATKRGIDVNSPYVGKYAYLKNSIQESSGAGSWTALDVADNRFNLTAVSWYGGWAKSGVEYVFYIHHNWNLTNLVVDLNKELKVTMLFYMDYMAYDTWYSNDGVYIDYYLADIGDAIDGGYQTHSPVPILSGEIVIQDNIDTGESYTWNPTPNFYAGTLNLTALNPNNYYILNLTPHVEAWNTGYIFLTGVFAVYFEQYINEPQYYPVTVCVNNPTWGSVSPSLGTYTYPSGTNITLSATANSEYYFDYWNVRNDLKGVNVNYTMNPLNLTVNMDYNITAYFTSSSPPPPSNYTLQLANYYFIPSETCVYLESLIPPTLLHNESSNWVSGTGTWSYPAGSTINLAITNDLGWYFYYWYKSGIVINEKNCTVNLNSDQSWRAIFLPPYQWITVKDATSGAELNSFYVYYGPYSWYVDASGCFIVGNYKTYTLAILSVGYYIQTIDVKLEKGTTIIYLTPITYTSGGGGGGPERHYSKVFTFNFIVLNATQNVYSVWNGLIEVYPFIRYRASLTLSVHYDTTYPVIEVYAESICMVKFNWTDIYHKLGCKYFDKVPTLTKFYGLRIESNTSLVLDFGLPSKPGELWKLLLGQDLPGTKLTDWKWRGGRVLLAFEPGDPTVSILLQTSMQQTQDVVFQFMMIMVTLVMVFAALKFIKDKF